MKLLSNCQKIGHILLCVLLINSCLSGEEVENSLSASGKQESQQFIENQLLCRAGEKDDALAALEQNIQTFRRMSQDQLETLGQKAQREQKGPSQKFRHFLDKSFPLFGKESWARIRDPRVYSYKYLNTRLSHLRNTFRSFEREYRSASQTMVKNFKREWRRELRQIEQMLSRLKSFKCRYNQMAQKKKKDIRSLVKILEDSCSNKSWTSSKVLEYTTKEVKKCSPSAKEVAQSFRGEFLDVCGKLKSREICQRRLSWDIHLNESGFVKSIMAGAFEKHLKSYFQLTRSQRKNILCRNSSYREKSISVYLNVTDKVERLFFARGVKIRSLKKHVESVWGSNKHHLKIRLVHDSSGIQIGFREDGVSRFINKKGKKWIQLNSHLRGAQLTQVFTHELGHALGFPDCYLEFYRHRTHSLTYYELGHEEKNLMCSLRFAGNVPKNYITQLKATYCR